MSTTSTTTPRPTSTNISQPTPTQATPTNTNIAVTITKPTNISTSDPTPKPATIISTNLSEISPRPTPTTNNKSTPKTTPQSTISQPFVKSDGSYGKTTEVVLTCFVVMFGLMFLIMVVKYYRLRKNIGDYRIQQGSQQTYDNPAFNGFG